MTTIRSLALVGALFSSLGPLAAVAACEPWQAGLWSVEYGCGSPAPAIEPAAPVPASAPAQSSPAPTSLYGPLSARMLRGERGWTSDNQFVRPSPGHEFFTAEMEIQNDTDLLQYFNPKEFDLILANDTRLNSVASWRSPDLQMGNILPRSRTRGWITFEVPRRVDLRVLIWRDRHTIELKRD
jgi:hypothetical protein